MQLNSVSLASRSWDVSWDYAVTSRTGQERICFCTHIVTVRTQLPAASFCQFLSAMLVKRGLQFIVLGPLQYDSLLPLKPAEERGCSQDSWHSHLTKLTKVTLLHLYWILLVSNALGGREGEDSPRPHPKKKSFCEGFCSQNGIKQKAK